MRIDMDLTAAPATPLVLAILAEGESYGYAILKRVRELTGGELEWTDAMIYPLFRRLRRLGYLTSEWRTLPEGHHRNYYAITEDGRAALVGRRRWMTVMRVLSGMWRSSGWLLTAVGEGRRPVTSPAPAW